MNTERIVTLLPSATEIVCALGFEDSLVGRTHECDYPSTIRGIPALTETKLRLDGTSYEIDQQVKAVLEQGLSIYRVDAGRLRELAPDVIVTQSQCDVCAVSEDELRDMVAEWLDQTPRIVSLNPVDLHSVWSDMQSVADALGAGERGRELVRRLQSRMNEIAIQARSLPARPRVACIEWIEPPMTAGNWMPELVEMAGGESLMSAAGEYSPRVTWRRIGDADPEVVIVMPCGFDIARTRAELRAVTDRPEWRAMRAVQTGHVYVADGNQYFNRPGPRIAESLEILAELIHPDAFHFGHEGSGWERM